MKTIRILLCLGLMLTLGLAACEGLPVDIPWLMKATPTATVSPADIGDVTETPEVTVTPEPTPEPVTELTLWVPPEMNPDSESAASKIFVNQLKLFSDLNGIDVRVRVKAASGPGGLLDALTSTSAAAPGALPDLIALTRSDLETAALKSLIFPLDGLTEIPDDTDWYPFTREMALLQGSTFGLPFAGDALTLVYRSELFPDFPMTWERLLAEGDGLLFPIESDQALFTLALYQAEGGMIQDNQRRPILEVDPLAAVYQLYLSGVDNGNFSDWTAQYQTPGQVWTAYQEDQGDVAATWMSNYLKDRPKDSSLNALLPMSTGSVSLGSGMSWAIATPDTHRHASAVALAEFLVQAEFLADWTAEAGYLPPRPSALERWEDQGLRTTVSQIALMTRLQPSNDLITSLGPVLQTSTRQVFEGLADPVTAAQLAVESLEAQ